MTHAPHMMHPLESLLPRLRARARRLSASTEEADDLTQEAALKLWQVLREGREIDALDRYAMTLLHNLARQRWRAARITEDLADDMAQSHPDAPVRMACHDLAAAIARLPPDHATLMRLVAKGETSPTALARQTGLPPGTVMSRLARARATLRRDLGLPRGAPVSELF